MEDNLKWTCANKEMYFYKYIAKLSKEANVYAAVSLCLASWAVLNVQGYVRTVLQSTAFKGMEEQGSM